MRAESGFRSGLEKDIAESLVSRGCPYVYEGLKIPYNNPSHYIPDFVLPTQAIVVEGKGEFKSDDRRKILLVKKQYPNLDVRIVFSRSSAKLLKGSKTTYAMWCGHNGIPYTDKVIPQAWLEHQPTEKQKEALAKLMGLQT